MKQNQFSLKQSDYPHLKKRQRPTVISRGTANLLPIKKVVELPNGSACIVLKDNSVKQIVRFQPFDILLSSAEQMQSVENAFKCLIEKSDFDLQFVISTDGQNLGYWSSISNKNTRDNEYTTWLGDYLNKYCNRLSDCSFFPNRQFYVIAGCNTGATPNFATASKNVQSVARWLKKGDMQPEVLTSAEVRRLFYELTHPFYNPQEIPETI
ncbi:MAG: hypothetical protein K2Z81_20115, partial [Cyanobacteria bacterium]|nr:hypothetical protein [Cyanobacteriota bacterium]